MKTLSAIFIGLTALVWGGCASAPGQAPVPAAATASRARVPMYFHLPTKDGKAITVDAIGIAAADRLTVRNQVMEYLKAQLIAQTATLTEAELAGGRLAEVISTAKAATLKHAQELKIAGVELTVTQVQITSM
jgi:hypothetical protein